MSEDVIGRLQRVPLFAGLRKAQLEEIIRVSGRRSFEQGQPIVRQGQETNAAFFLILDGQVEVRKDDRMLCTLGGGQFFGEMSLFDGEPRSAEAVATVDTECLVIARWNLEQVIKDNPDVAMRMLGELSRRLRAVEAHTSFSG